MKATRKQALTVDYCHPSKCDRRFFNGQAKCYHHSLYENTIPPPPNCPFKSKHNPLSFPSIHEFPHHLAVTSLAQDTCNNFVTENLIASVYARTLTKKISGNLAPWSVQLVEVDGSRTKKSRPLWGTVLFLL